MVMKKKKDTEGHADNAVMTLYVYVAVITELYLLVILIVIMLFHPLSKHLIFLSVSEWQRGHNENHKG